MEKINYKEWRKVDLVSELESRDRERNNFFVITSVSREDLEERGYDTSKVEDFEMRKIAGKMADAYVGGSFWEDMEQVADYLKIPKKK